MGHNARPSGDGAGKPKYLSLDRADSARLANTHDEIPDSVVPFVTGANGNLGRRLLARMPGRGAVRSPRALATLEESGCDDAVIVDYADEDAMAAAMAGCTAVVHLVGVIKENATTSFTVAHEETTQHVIRAAERAGIKKIVYMSIVGSNSDSANACLASKGRAEDALLECSIPAAILRVPMVLGEGDYASRALLARGASAMAFTFRAGSLEQPVYAGNVIDAVVALLANDMTGVVELAGPRSLTRRELIQCASTRGTRVVSIPYGLGWLFAACCERLMANPPLSRAMLGVLDHDDRVDSAAATAAELGIELTPIEEAIARLKGAESAPR